MHGKYTLKFNSENTVRSCITYGQLMYLTKDIMTVISPAATKSSHSNRDLVSTVIALVISYEQLFAA